MVETHGIERVMVPKRQQAVGKIAKHRAHLGAESVVYRRGLASVGIWAIPRIPDPKIDLEAEPAIGFIDLDWSLPADALRFGGTVTLPEPGDLLDRTLPDNRRERYEVLPRGEADCWIGEDGVTALIRVHTKRISIG